ncbi:helix-turn-helix transcriptional regulator [Phaeobacter sp. NW0010-22]|jgi:transcriptional regulator with XRE-family HTH domain|uniref:helix-turn-helix transcriptional regulator n=1 Tax=Phaeobacter sp. NW0010-22 TaxID=3135907 RepID=UPI003107656D
MFATEVDQSGETRAAWAKRLGVSRSYMSDLLNGNRIPSLELAAKIERLTAGKVTAVSWVEEGGE